MPEDLGARLVRAGLVSREQLTDMLARGPVAGGSLAARLVDDGVTSEEALVGLFVADGYGPLQDAQDLGRATPDVVGRMGGEMALTLMALPTQATADGLVVAMADPSDRDAVIEMERLLEAKILPAVARLSDLRAALALAYPGATARPLATPVALVQRKEGPKAPESPNDGEVVLPLVRAKPFAPIRRTFHKPSGALPRQTPTTASYSSPPGSTGEEAPVEAKPTSIIPPHEASWADLPPPSKTSSPTVSREKNLRADFGAVLAEIRASKSRDEIVRLACEGAVTVARSAVFLALRKGILRGWEGLGAGIAPDALRNLWIPATSPSMFKTVLGTGEAHYGPYGTSAADNLFRAATGSRGGSIAIQPIAVGNKTVGLLCANDVPPATLERVEVLAHAVGTAFKRVIMASR